MRQGKEAGKTGKRTAAQIPEAEYLEMLKSAMQNLSGTLGMYSCIWWVSDEIDEAVKAGKQTVEELNKLYEAVAEETEHPTWQNLTYFGIRAGLHRSCKSDIIGFHHYGTDDIIHENAPKLAADRQEMHRQWWAEQKLGAPIPPIAGRPLLRVWRRPSEAKPAHRCP